MTEKPILFSGPMVRALLSGSKTQTRRVIKTQPQVVTKTDAAWRDVKSDLWRNSRQYLRDCCPYPIGTRLWVRETWRPWGWREDNPITIQYQADGAIGECCPDNDEWYERIAEESTRECEVAGLPRDGEGCYHWIGIGRDCPIKWRPSIFLPREGSRITLEVVDVRAQRVREISAYDAEAEGILPAPDWTAAMKFAVLWDSINGKKCPWASNPWVWAYTFRVVEGGPNATT